MRASTYNNIIYDIPKHVIFMYNMVKVMMLCSLSNYRVVMICHHCDNHKYVQMCEKY